MPRPSLAGDIGRLFCGRFAGPWRTAADKGLRSGTCGDRGAPEPGMSNRMRLASASFVSSAASSKPKSMPAVTALPVMGLRSMATCAVPGAEKPADPGCRNKGPALHRASFRDAALIRVLGTRGSHRAAMSFPRHARLAVMAEKANAESCAACRKWENHRPCGIARRSHPRQSIAGTTDPRHAANHRRGSVADCQPRVTFSALLHARAPGRREAKARR